MGSVGATLVAILALVGAPLAVVILAAAMLGFWVSDIPLTVVAIEMYRIVETPMLLALPLFTFAGYVLAESQMSSRMVALTSATLGWLPGGLAVVAFVTCAFFTAFTGASGVTIVAIGALLYPALQQGGYTERFSLGLVTTSGSLGPTIGAVASLDFVRRIGSTNGLAGSIYHSGFIFGWINARWLDDCLANSVYGVYPAVGRNHRKSRSSFSSIGALGYALGITAARSCFGWNLLGVFRCF